MGKHKKSRKEVKKCDTSSSSEEWVEAELVRQTKKKKKSSKKRYSSSSVDSSIKEVIKKKNESSSVSSEDNCKSSLKKKKKRKTKRKYDNSSSESSEEEKETSIENKMSEPSTSSKREEWMDLSTSFSSFSNVDRKKQRQQEKEIDRKAQMYDPRKYSRELNPYWKDGGDGLPKFKKPTDEEDIYQSKLTNKESNWRKRKVGTGMDVTHDNNTKSDHTQGNSDKPVTKQDLNVLAGKILKAELMGNEKLAKELKEKLEQAQKSSEATSEDNEVLLTHTDSQGRSKPVTSLRDREETTKHKKRHKEVVETHQQKQRTKYFPDDDKYSLKQMFENEKFNTANDQDSEFLKVVSSANKNDDLDDFFVDNVRRKKSNSIIDEINRTKAINEHQSMSKSLDNCKWCIQSDCMQKHLIVSMGEYIYLGIPAHDPLTQGHCLIIPIRHVPCVTQLDENEWAEILDFRKALVKLFHSKSEDVIFFEIAASFHKHPHMVLECVPLPQEEGSMAPIYFKKAIDESETEWAQNKKLVSLKGRDVRRAIPKGLPYFSVSFGMEEGFAHVIEDEMLFPKNFAQEIIGGMLDLDHKKWRKPIKQLFTDQSKRVLEFSNEWKVFDCTVKS